MCILLQTAGFVKRDRMSEEGLQADAYSPDYKLCLCNAQVIEPVEFPRINALQEQSGPR